MRSPIVVALAGVLQRAGITAPTNLLVAVSGGPDSVCLGHATTTWARQRRVGVVLAHYDHRWRPDSGLDRQLVADLARRWDCGFASAAADDLVAPASGQSAELLARNQRWEFLEEAARSCGAEAILSGHHLGDQAETLLLRLLRGAGARGLAAMEEINGSASPPRLRPLLAIERRQILAYLAEFDLPYRLDPSNDESIADRNRIRKAVMPALRAIRPGVERTIARAAQNLREEAEAIDICARLAFDQAGAVHYFGAYEISRAGLAGIEAGLGRLLLRDLAGRVSGQYPRRDPLGAGLRFALESDRGPASFPLTPLTRIERSRGRLLVCASNWRPPRLLAGGSLAVPGSLSLPDPGLTLTATAAAPGPPPDCGPGAANRAVLLLEPPLEALTLEPAAAMGVSLAGLPSWRRAAAFGLRFRGQPVYVSGLPPPRPPPGYGPGGLAVAISWQFADAGPVDNPPGPGVRI